MNYPTLEEVEKASKIQLGKWVRFLNSPGMSAVESGSDDIEPVRIKEAAIAKAVLENRVNQMLAIGLSQEEVKAMSDIVLYDIPQWDEEVEKAKAKVAPIQKEAQVAKAEAEAKERAEKEAKAKRAAERFIGIEGMDVLLAWWKSGIFHPAPAEVIKAKEAAGMTWKEVRQFCKASV